MIKPPRSDFWRVGILPARIQSLLEPAAVEPLRNRITWLPDPGPWRYLADPFAVRRDDALHVFVEAYDYRTKHAHIERHEFSLDLQWRAKDVALSRAFHLSYPFIVQAAGETFMIPESHQAGELALYVAQDFPHGWVRETALLSGVPAAEPSLLHHQGRWWLFFTIVGPHGRDQRELHVATADALTSPWRLHPQNPILDDRRGARPGGTPFIGANGRVVLPVQDCSAGYGGALRLLQFDVLETDHIEVSHHDARLTGDLVSATHTDGFHTLSACGELTCFDARRTVRAWGRHVINLQRHLRQSSHRILHRTHAPARPQD
jgi:hypothetical protein